MRQIYSKEELDKKTRKKQLIVGVVLIVLMVISTIGFAFMNNEQENNTSDTITYAGFKFTNNGGVWNSEINGHKIQTAYNPQETENLSIKISGSLSDFYKKPLYITSSSEGNYELLKNLNQFIERYQEACLKGENCTGLVEKGCSDNVIIFKNTNLSLIYKSNNCLYIEGPSQEHIRMADGVIFKLLGIQ